MRRQSAGIQGAARGLGILVRQLLTQEDMSTLSPTRSTLFPSSDSQSGRKARESHRQHSRVGGKYEILHVLGHGGMGHVFKARCVETGRVVALKLMRSSQARGTRGRARFLREASLLRRLRHPNTIRILDCNVDKQGNVYIAMELAQGASLATIIRMERRLKELEALDIASQICASLQEAHDQGIVHRDIKPANVIVARRGEELTVKVVDFGIGKLVESREELTRPGDFLGSRSHCAPEQLLGDPVDARSDVYAIGVLLYEMLTGVRPFESRPGEARHIAVFHRTPPPMQRVAPDANVSEATQAIVWKCLSRSPSGRYASALELMRAIGECRDQLMELTTLVDEGWPETESWFHGISRTVTQAFRNDVLTLVEDGRGYAATLVDVPLQHSSTQVDEWEVEQPRSRWTLLPPPPGGGRTSLATGATVDASSPSASMSAIIGVAATLALLTVLFSWLVAGCLGWM